MLDIRTLSKFEKPDMRRAVWQLVNTFVPYVALWTLMVWMLKRGSSYWLVLPLIVLASGLLVRVFVFFHDCCHGAFFASRRANKTLGTLAGIVTLTSFEGWQHAHNRHHATAGVLDHRGV